jgi:endoglucanase
MHRPVRLYKTMNTCLRGLLLATLWLFSAPLLAQATPPPAATGVPPQGIGEGASRKAWAAAAALSRGVNLSVYAAPREGDWGLRMDDRWIDTLAQAGFRSVRLSVRWSNHAAPGIDAALDEAFAQRIDRVIDACLARNQMVVLGMIFYNQMDDKPTLDGELRVAPEVVRARFVNLWRNIALRYANRSDRLLFELYNAPRGDALRWNQLSAQALAAVRQSNAERVVVMSPLLNEPSQLDQLALPRDQNLIISFHSRDPKEFTSQGSPGVKGSDQWLGTDCCNPQQRDALTVKMNLAKQWSDRHRYPVWLGSFGAASTAPMASRARYLRAVRHEAEARGISWAHTDFAANFNVRDPPDDSGIYDVVHRQWHSVLRDALLGQ